MSSSIRISIAGSMMLTGVALRSPKAFDSSSKCCRAASSKSSGSRTVCCLFLMQSSFTSDFAGWSPGFLLSASGRTAFDPGLYVMRKLNWDKNLDHRTWHWLRALVVVKYSRFLWSVTMSNGSAEPWSSGLHSSSTLIMASSSLS